MRALLDIWPVCLRPGEIQDENDKKKTKLRIGLMWVKYDLYSHKHPSRFHILCVMPPSHVPYIAYIALYCICHYSISYTKYHICIPNTKTYEHIVKKAQMNRADAVCVYVCVCSYAPTLRANIQILHSLYDIIL